MTPNRFAALLALGLMGCPSTPSDTTAPTVVRTVPDRDGSGVATNAKISIEFSEEMDSATVTADSIRLTAGTAAISASVSYSDSEKKAELTAAQPLSENTQYTVTVSTAAKDLAGNALAAAYTWKFTTTGAAPQIVSTTPADGAAGVARDVQISFVFDKAIDPSSLTGSFTLSDSTVSMPVPATQGWDEARFTATLAPSGGLNEGHIYVATAKAGIKGTNGFTLPADRVVTFTVVNDVPVVLSTTPADMAMAVMLDAPLTATFSEPIDPATLDTTTFFLREGSAPLAAAVQLNASRTVATLVPAAPLLEGRTYTVTLTTGVKDDFANALAAAKTWSFGTLLTIPTVTGITPTNLAMGVAGNTPVRVTFSEAMDPASISSMTFVVSSGASGIPGTRVWDAATRTATFQPSGAYPGGSTISVELRTGLEDPSGNGLAADVTSSFVVSNAPSVTASMPAPNDVGVPLGSSVQLTFSTAMDVATLIAPNVWVEDAAGNKLPASYTASSSNVVIAPSAMFSESQRYTVVVTPGVRSATNVAFGAEYRFGFTTSGIPPQVTATAPSANAVEVPVSSKVTVTFSEDMNAATFTAAGFKLSDGANDVAGTLSAMGTRTLVFTPAAPLRARQRFTATVSSAVTDAAGNALAAPHVFSFSTEGLPRLTSVQPVNGASPVALGARIVLGFDEDIASMIRVTGVAASMNDAVTIVNAAGARVDGAVTYSPATFTAVIRPQAAGSDIQWAASTRYTVSIDGSKLLDANGNAVGGLTVFSFVTGPAADTTPPTVVSTDPGNGATGWSRSAPVWAELSEQISAASVNATTVRVLDGTTALSGSAAFDPSTRRVSFTPAGLLPPARALTFEVGAVTDLSGNAKAATNTIGFTTADNVAPAIASSAPANGDVSVPVNSAIRVTFTEPIDPRSLDMMSSVGTGMVTYDAASASALFVPDAPFVGGLSVKISVVAGLADLEGKQTAAPLEVTFTTVGNASQDVIAPTVASLIPAANATGVGALQPVTVSFSEPMRAGTVLAASSYTLRERGGPNVLHRAAFNAAGDQLVLTPLDALKGGVVYELALTSAMKDLAGNSLSGQTTSFTVESTRPTVVSTSPSSGSTVGSGVQVSVVFSEALDASTISASTFGVSAAGGALLGAVSYDAASRTAVFQPSKPLADGMHTVTLQAAAIRDLAGNALMVGAAVVFTVSSTGPSVASALPCGTQIDSDDFGTQTVTVRFDRPVRRSGGAALDATAVKLQRAGSDQMVSVTHTADTDTAVLTPAAALLPGETYTVVATTLVLATNNSAPMASQYACTFTTQRVVFQDAVNDTVTTGWTLTAAGGNQWQRINSGDDVRSSIVWRGGASSDGSNYARECTSGLQGAASDRVVTLEKQIDLTGYSSAEVRFLAMDDVQRMGVADEARLIVNDGTDHIVKAFTGQNAGNAYVREGKGSGNLTPYVNRTVRVKWQLVIKGYSAGLTGNCATQSPAGRKGFFVDDVIVVGQ